MTTTAYDKTALQVTSDSRWSYKLNQNEFLYVDNTEFDKIAHRNQFCLFFAGNGKLIESWKQWLLRKETLNLGARPPVVIMGNGVVVDFVSACMVEKTTGKIWFDSEREAIKVGEDARFSGTGAPAAKKCWEVNKCARTAIGSACEADPYSGGEIKYLILSTGSHNLSAINDGSLSLSSVDEAVKARGFHMDIAANTSTSIAEHIQGADLLRAVGNQLVASAPTGASIDWTRELEAEFNQALQRAIDEGKL